MSDTESVYVRVCVCMCESERDTEQGRKEGGRLGRWQHFLIRATKDTLVISLTLRTFLQHILLVLFIPHFCPVTHGG